MYRNIKISVISTLKNEEDCIKPFLENLLNQSVQPDEIILVDGGSTDSTIPTISEYIQNNPKIKLLVKANAGISKGRNIAIKNATSDIIVTTDVCSFIDKNWLLELITPFKENYEKWDVSSGYYIPEVKSWYEECLAAVIYHPIYEINSKKFNPSSRSLAFKKEVWENIGGYPELYYSGEDLIFDLKAKYRGYKFYFAKKALVSYQMEPTLYKFFRKYRLYGYGDGQANLWFFRHVIRYITYIGGVLLLFLGFKFSYIWAVFIFMISLYLYRPYRRIHFLKYLKEKSILYRLRAYLSIPFILFVGDLGKMLGYTEGQWERIRGIDKSNRINKYTGH
ncbi:MAG: glycosyltransferase [bacterium]|nr:glycosyltransferase [bacterium]